MNHIIVNGNGAHGVEQCTACAAVCWPCFDPKALPYHAASCFLKAVHSTNCAVGITINEKKKNEQHQFIHL